MDTFILLGIIPGTSFQINFDDWVRGMILLSGLLLCWLLFRNRLKIALLLFFITMRWRNPADVLTARTA